MWRALTTALAGLLAALLVGAAAAPASAHATLVSTDPTEGEVLPESPGEVVFTFDEPVSLVTDGVQVFDAQGERVDADASSRDAVVTADLPDELADGTYVVTWRVVSSDGHPIAGSLTFSVGEPSPTVAAPDTSTDTDGGPLDRVVGAVQALGYVALLVAGGLVFFRLWTVRGVRLTEDVRRRLGGLNRVAAVASVALAALLVPLAGAYQRGVGVGGLVEAASYDPGLVRDDLVVLALQAVGFGLALMLAPRTGRAVQLGVLGAALAVWSPALVGHTRAYAPAPLLVATDALHLSAGAVWLGGLVGLVLTLGALRGRDRDSATVLTRFSTVAAGLLAVLGVTGVLLGWRILGAWAPLFDTGYGRLLLIKLAIAMVVVAIAAWNRTTLLPALAAGGHDRRRRIVGSVRRTASVEALLLVGLLGVTGFLVQQAPGGEGGTGAAATGGTGAVTATAEDWRVVAVVDAGGGRKRGLSIQIQDQTGEPIDLAGTPEVSLRSDGGGRGIDLGRVPVRPVGTGTYRAEVVFPTGGEWQVQVSLPVDRFTNPVTTVEITVD